MRIIIKKKYEREKVEKLSSYSVLVRKKSVGKDEEYRKWLSKKKKEEINHFKQKRCKVKNI